MFNEVLGFNIQKEKYNNDKMKKKKFPFLPISWYCGNWNNWSSRTFLSQNFTSFLHFLSGCRFCRCFLGRVHNLIELRTLKSEHTLALQPQMFNTAKAEEASTGRPSHQVCARLYMLVLFLFLILYLKKFGKKVLYHYLIINKLSNF